MKSVRVDIKELREKVEENQSKHRAQFEDAIEGWQKAVISHLEKMTERAKKGKRIELYINLPQPEDHTSDYDRVLAMLDMSVEDEIELSAQEFSQFVMDDWGWKEQFISTNALYSSNSR